MTWLLLAFRSIARQRHRSTIALAAVAFGVVALLIAGGFVEWLFWAMREDTVRSRLGHIQVVRPGYHDEGVANPMAYLISDERGAIERVEAMPGVTAVSPRLAVSGLASHGAQTIPFIGEAVDPEKEARFKRLDAITQGSDLSPSEPTGVTLGRGLAESLGVRAGDGVVLLANARSGGINAVEARVRGVFSTSSRAYDDVAIRVPLELGRKLLGVSGSHVWAVLLDRTEDLEPSLPNLAAAVRDRGLTVVPWTRLADLYNKTVALFSRQVAAVKLIVAAIIVLGISNTMMMRVIERTGEIGTAMALGTSRRGILLQYVGEGLLIGLIGGGVGLVAGVALAAVVSHFGIPMPPAPGMVRGYTAGIMVTPRLALDALLIAASTALVASLYPAWRASRLNIVDALRHNR